MSLTALTFAASTLLAPVPDAGAGKSFRFEPAQLASLQSGDALPTTFETLAGTGLRLTRKSIVEAPGEAADGIHFQFVDPRNQDREASILLREGRLAGFIATTGGRYELRSLKPGSALASLAGAASERPCGVNDEHRAPAPSQAGDGGLAGVGCDDGSLINVYVAYTDAAVAQAGGESQMLDQILWAFGDSNTIYANSGILVEIQLRGTERASGYVEDATAMANDLYALRDPFDGVLDGAMANATAAGADLTALVRANGGGACGIAFLVGGSVDDVAYGVSVTALGCFSNRTFTHELGHNMGCCHAPGDGGGCLSGGVFPYSTGHRFFGTNGTEYRTVMAYAPGSRIGHFSSPSVLYQGTPTGLVDERDNARTINETRFTIANFRCAPCPADLNGDRVIDAADLSTVLGNWGEGVLTGDLDGDGNTGASDLSILLGA
ncbi:MAG: hypothetical protein RIR10_1243, partial [Planctomycetota bacterium]